MANRQNPFEEGEYQQVLLARQFKKGDKVFKHTGYSFPGVIACVFETLAGDIRVVVESTTPQTQGMLHIFNPQQLTLDDWEP